MWRLPICAIALVLGSACSNSDNTSEVVSEAEALSAAGAAASSEAPTTYGVTDFDATGSPEAYPVFLRGLLQLHNFEFEDARDSFIEAQEIDPDFYMAYWGEALSHKQPLWNREDLPAGRAALAKLAPTPEARLELAPTERERAYMAAAHRLFSEEGTELEIETDYAEMLGDIYDRWPDDLDAGALYALAILTTSHNGREFDKYMRAGAITEEILDSNPLHPGALHYNIHAYDDPIHAPLGLRSARVYSDVAPDAVHALHMPSHIFLALGDFEGTRDLNRRSYDASVARSATHDGVLFRNEAYHAHSWLLYAHIQLHEFEEARGMLDYLQSQVAAGDDVAHGQLIMGRAFLALETGDWDDTLLEVEVDLARVSPMHLATEHYIRARRALAQNDLASMERHVNEIAVPESSGPGARNAVPRVLKDIGQGQLLIAQGHADEGIELLKAAAELEHSLPPFIGPPVIVQPAGEAAGDALRAMGDSMEAVRYYNMTLERAVNKTRSQMAVSAIRAGA